MVLSISKEDLLPFLVFHIVNCYYNILLYDRDEDIKIKINPLIEKIISRLFDSENESVVKALTCTLLYKVRHLDRLKKKKV